MAPHWRNTSGKNKKSNAKVPYQVFPGDDAHHIACRVYNKKMPKPDAREYLRALSQAQHSQQAAQNA